MTIAPFKQFMASVDRDIERRRIEAMPDVIWTYDEAGNRLYGRPNFDKPGVAERVERDAFEAELAANPPRSSIGLLLTFVKTRRFNADQRERYP